MTVDLGPHEGITLNLREDAEEIREAIARRLKANGHTWEALARKGAPFAHSPLHLDSEIKSQAYHDVLRAVEAHWDKSGPRAVAQVALREIMRHAAFPARSTSPTSIQLEQERAAAWCEVLDYLCGLP